MNLVLELDREQETELQRNAALKGMDVSGYIRNLLVQELAKKNTQPSSAIIGAFQDQPQLIDDALQLAMQDREQRNTTPVQQ